MSFIVITFNDIVYSPNYCGRSLFLEEDARAIMRAKLMCIIGLYLDEHYLDAGGLSVYNFRPKCTVQNKVGNI